MLLNVENSDETLSLSIFFPLLRARPPAHVVHHKIINTTMGIIDVYVYVTDNDDEDIPPLCLYVR